MLIANKSVAQPWECDVMQHMTTRFFMARFDDASYHLLLEAFGWSSKLPEAKRQGWADVRQVIEYLAEVTAGDVLEVRAEFRKLGGKSFTAFYEMNNLSTGELAATLESVCVCFDLEKRRALTISEAMRERAAAYLAD